MGAAMVLVGDVGGTNTRLALAEGDTGEVQLHHFQVFPSREHGSLEGILREYLRDRERGFRAACFGVAGPVGERSVRTTNLPWRVDGRELARALELPLERVGILNDLEAMAWGVPLLTPDTSALILEGHDGEPEAGNAALIAPGTGLGEAGMLWNGSAHIPFASEGGHTDFAPRDAVERELLASLSRRHGHVSWERVLSGPGLVVLHRFLCRRAGDDLGGCRVGSLEDEAGAPEAITRSAAEGGCPACVETLDRFCRMLGAQAGNLALTLKATGGVWIGGGIAPDILEPLRKGSFREGFLGKGRMRPLMERIPVRVILDEEITLRGADRWARA